MTKSWLTFSPKSWRHYGQFVCRATNTIDGREEACVINVVPSELPDPVFGCFFDGFTNSSFSVHCQASSLQSATSGAGRQTYLLELYKSASSSSSSLDDDDELDGRHKSSSSSTHLKQRQEINVANDDDNDNDNDGDIDGAENDNNNQQHTKRGQQHRKQVRRLTSDTPTFQVTNLKADTSYSVVIYVQNARGRSEPVLYERSTLSADNSGASEAAESGTNQAWQQSTMMNGAGSSSSSVNDEQAQIEFSSSNNNNKQRKQAANGGKDSTQSTLTNRLVAAYFKLIDFFSSSSNNNNNKQLATKPLVASIVLVLMLCTLSIIVVGFFITRLCSTKANFLHRQQQQQQQTLGNNKSAKRKRRLMKGASVTPAAASATLDASKLMIYGDQRAQPALDSSVQLKPASNEQQQQLIEDKQTHNNNNRFKALAGSSSTTSTGDNTSRETNTDSTALVSRTMLLVSKQQAANNEENLSLVVRSNNNNNNHTSHQSYKVPTTIQQQQQLLLVQKSITPSMSPPFNRTDNSSLYASRINRQAQAFKSLQEQQQHTASPVLQDQVDQSNTPQVSIQSSDCTSNEHELMASLDAAAQFHHHHHQHCDHRLLIKSPAAVGHHEEVNILSEPVYVISSSSSEYQPAAGAASDQCALTHEQMRLFNPINSGLWTCDAANYGQVQAGDVGCGAGSAGSTTGTQVSSSLTTGDSFEPGSSTEHNNSSYTNFNNNQSFAIGSALPTTVSLLPNSMSIPLSLSECMHSLDERAAAAAHHQTLHRLMSHNDFCQANLCLASVESNGPADSYLTLTPDNHQCQQAAFDNNKSGQALQIGRCTSRQSTNEHRRKLHSSAVSPTNSYASTDHNHHHHQPQPRYHDQSLVHDLSRIHGQQQYAASTLDDSYRQATKRCATGNSVTFDKWNDSRRSSFNSSHGAGRQSELSLVQNQQASSTQPNQRHHVKFDQQFIQNNNNTNTVVYHQQPTGVDVAPNELRVVVANNLDNRPTISKAQNN